MKQRRLLVVIAGPTAVGKTQLCVELARFYSTEIVSADSRQFYKEMCIGTAKPTLEEQHGIPHHFIDFLSVSEPYNAGQFEKEAITRIEKVIDECGICILTGGSGLYLRAITNGIDEMPEVPEEVRSKYNSLFEKEGLRALQERVKKADPEYYEEVDRQNPVRLIRALEVIDVSGRTYSSFRTQQRSDRPFDMVKIVLDRPREELYDRIDRRMDIMIDQGLFGEAGKLFHLRDLTALQTVGYQEIFGFLEDKYDREEAIRLLKRNSRRYAKRQLTWFRKEEDWQWFHPQEADAIKSLIDRKLSEGSDQIG